MAIESATTATVTGVSSMNARQFQSLFSRILFARVAFEEDSIADTSASAAVYTLPGVKQGDIVLVSAVSDLGDELSFSGSVTDTDEVTIFVYNGKGAASTKAATVGNLNIIVLGVEDNMFLGAAGA